MDKLLAGNFKAYKYNSGEIYIKSDTGKIIDDIPSYIGEAQLKHSLKTGLSFSPRIRKNGDIFLRWEKSDVKPSPKPSAKKVEATESLANLSTIKEDDTIKLIHDSYKLKPSYLTMSEAKWKVLVRAALRGLNIIMTGDAGEGKTLAAYALKDALQRPFFYINLGNTQDAQTSLIGKTHLDAKSGTYFAQSYFIKAIQTPNAVILLDEITRASFDAMNILITVLDKKQRYLRVSDDPDSPTIKVASGVSFIATANVGFKYSGTVKLDHAIMDRFIKIEVDALSSKERLKLITDLHGNANKKVHDVICKISHDLKSSAESDSPMVGTAPSTRQVLEMAEFIEDGFSLTETLDVLLYPNYDKEERIFVKTLVQKYDEKIEDNDQLNAHKTGQAVSDAPDW